LRSTLAILVVLSIAASLDTTIAQPRPDGLFEIDPANLADLPPGIMPPQTIGSRAVSAADYPVESLPAQEMGTTILRYVVLEDGSVGPSEILSSSGSPRLDQAAAVIVRRWRFTPALQNGRPIRVWQRANVVFNLSP
jgi:TonB family protein